MPAEDTNPSAISPTTDRTDDNSPPVLDAAVPDTAALVTEVIGEGTIVSHGETLTFLIAIHSTDLGAAGRCVAHGDHGTSIKVKTLGGFDRTATTVTFTGHAMINGRYVPYRAEIVNRADLDESGHDSFIIRAANRSYLGRVRTGRIVVEDHGR